VEIQKSQKYRSRKNLIHGSIRKFLAVYGTREKELQKNGKKPYPGWETFDRVRKPDTSLCIRNYVQLNEMERKLRAALSTIACATGGV